MTKDKSEKITKNPTGYEKPKKNLKMRNAFK